MAELAAPVKMTLQTVSDWLSVFKNHLTREVTPTWRCWKRADGNDCTGARWQPVRTNPTSLFMWLFTLDGRFLLFIFLRVYPIRILICCVIISAVKIIAICDTINNYVLCFCFVFLFFKKMFKKNKCLKKLLLFIHIIVCSDMFIFKNCWIQFLQVCQIWQTLQMFKFPGEPI